MTTNKPGVEAYLISDKGDPSLRSVRRAENHDASITSTLFNIEPLIRLSDYEALQAECEKLVEALESAKNLIANHSGETLPEHYAGDQVEQIDDALAAYRAQGGEHE